MVDKETLAQFSTMTVIRGKVICFSCRHICMEFEAYRCFYCKHYYCEDCAKEHFEKRE